MKKIMNRRLPSGRIYPEEVADIGMDEIYAMPKRNRPSEAFIETNGGYVYVECCRSETCRCISHRAVKETRMVEVAPGVFDFCSYGERKKGE